ncbi:MULTISPECIES: PEP-CTERM sorting domain-containing protein [unclassified Alteromonas]|uniref:PEP-CTERM sorting domain-containing protein n=1 Tax=unclassified Alteromonas TaxID=2614992 RepID=UPI0019206A03|nr:MULTISPECIES: PEP-CTERM sorting domain-containing protein [unclassified Alteromonas]
MKKIICFVILSLMSFVTHSAIITGIANDLLKTDVSNDGWTIQYQGAYSGSFSWSSLLAGVDSSKYMALASSSSDGATTYDLFAAIKVSDFLVLSTALNETQLFNGAYWYRSSGSGSVGFSPTSGIFQNSADVCNTSLFGDPGCAGDDGSERLSWHMSSNDNVFGGWRSGLTTNLNSDSTWQRYVLLIDAPQQGPTPAPEPGSIVMIGLGLAGLVVRRRTKK